MSSFSALNQATAGIQSNLRGLKASAHEVASRHAAGDQAMELVEPLVRSIEYQRVLEASAQLLRRSDELLGTLIDTFA